jgi:hypothetical protein
LYVTPLPQLGSEATSFVDEWPFLVKQLVVRGIRLLPMVIRTLSL